ncbi:uncharacterized protein MYCFIDRAFT_169483 [Pseudocercospora fijiensis CIRAD86]|uniref:Uncharacterized protein n=1 Tax=Pseudocercospora fijiensis (strain CIRAD86) TaxID=383855 RepID=N1Q658_PSEFD|nr:uncharacterized protein MYCFIDRAFT_169483 [Pseudocercospora fijiensis CIRAD86]EME87710.1 hypothetical protein MYCFIDRAFT_169483 [Pseudocercospora fijiensis CIRAD86]
MSCLYGKAWNDALLVSFGSFFLCRLANTNAACGHAEFSNQVMIAPSALTLLTYLARPRALTFSAKYGVGGYPECRDQVRECSGVQHVYCEVKAVECLELPCFALDKIFSRKCSQLVSTLSSGGVACGNGHGLRG